MKKMLLQYFMLIVFVYLVLYIPMWYIRSIDKQNRIEWETHKIRLIKRCYDEAYKAKGDEWTETCLANSYSGDCTLPINYYHVLADELSKDYDRCIAIYSDTWNKQQTK